MAWKRTSHKYSAKKVDLDGRSFGSKLEAAVYGILKLFERAGEIRDIECQVQVELSAAKIVYKPDFRFLDVNSGRTEYAEAKGFETPEWRLKRRLWKAYGPGPLHVYMGSYANPKLTETIIPEGL